MTGQNFLKSAFGWLAPLAVLLFLSLLSACSSSPPAPSGESGIQTYYSKDVQQQVIEQGPLAANSEGSEIKCRRLRKPGSHFAIRVCRTLDEWDTNNNETQRDLQMRQATESLVPAEPEWGTGGG